MNESERAVKGSTGTRSDAKEKRKTEGRSFFFPFPVTPLALFAVHASRVKKKMTIRVSEYTVLSKLVSKKNRPLRLSDPIVKW